MMPVALFFWLALALAGSALLLTVTGIVMFWDWCISTAAVVAYFGIWCCVIGAFAYLLNRVH